MKLPFMKQLLHVILTKCFIEGTLIYSYQLQGSFLLSPIKMLELENVSREELDHNT